VKSLNVNIPDSQITHLEQGESLQSFMENPHDPMIPVIEFVFAEESVSLVVIPKMFPVRMLELAMVKIRDFIRVLKAKDFFAQKITTYFPGRDHVVREMMNTLFSQPLECLQNILSGSDFNFSFFLCLHNLVKVAIHEEIEGDARSNPVKVAMLQSIGILLVFTNYYRAITVTQNDKNVAFAAAYAKLSEPPYCYSRSQIIRFPSKTGVPILSGYSDEDVDSFLKEKLNTGGDGELPELLIFKGPDNDNLYVKKEKVNNLAARLIIEARASVKEAVIHHWEYMLKNYRSEPAMQRDRDFDEFLMRLCTQCSQLLIPIIRDNKVRFLETEMAHKNIGSAPQYFIGNEPVPLRNLLLLRRNEILDEIRISLPFWYSWPLVVSIIRFFKYGKQGKATANAKTAAPHTAAVPANENSLKKIAERIAQDILPKEQTVQSWLAALTDRWNMLLDKTARARLSRDVDNIIKDHMRYVAKVQSLRTINSQMLDEIAERIILTNSSLGKISDKDSLVQYIKLFIVKSIID
jgi:hypothetical protein